MLSCLQMKPQINYLKFYKKYRCKIADLYPSEKAILAQVDLRKKSILDVGCACGGFYKIFKRIAADIDYFGLDISEELIGYAKRRFPEIAGRFLINPGMRFPFEDKKFDIVFCASVQAHCLQYGKLFRECWRVSKEALIFDFRFSLKDKTVNLARPDSDIPYIVSDINKMFGLIKNLEGLKELKMDSYKIQPNRNQLKESGILKNRDVYCGLLLLKR